MDRNSKNSRKSDIPLSNQNVTTENVFDSQFLIKKHFDLLFEYSPFAIFFTDFSGLILECNKKAELFYNRSQSELIGSSIHSLITYPSKELSVNKFSKLHDSPSIEYEFQVICNDVETTEIHRIAYAFRHRNVDFSDHFPLTASYSW